MSAWRCAVKAALLMLFVTVPDLAAGWSAEELDWLRKRANQIFQPLPARPTQVTDDPASRAREELGKMLFFDPRLSRSGTISCITCHNPGSGGADNLSTSIGHGGQRGPRNAPTVFNSAHNIAQFWDGRAADLEAQAVVPIQSPFEMNNTPDRVEATLESIPAYVQRFAESFPEDAEPVTFANVARALAAFEATLITPDAPFDRFLRGDDHAMSEQQLHGLRKFIGQGCVTCHRRVNVGGNAFFPFGMMKPPGETVRPPDDKGRSQVTGRLIDEFVFRVAPLRNVALTAPYFHSGQVWDLEEAVRIMARTQLNATLPEEDVKDIVAFLHALTGEQPEILYPILPPRTASTPRPEH